ncbi:alanine dehydrogenase [Marinobacterium lutimaris]|uniref:Alanine dehydrogenase n=1 Tax=Marinobacterium lutimaris TaxID=568106 RepID=A0A1H6DBD2_9GAMM|nr:alanine dehydrogenase [Marinobacterium lutimaris]SEG82757.1 L-alanine dehydrogenase [Marinobacterium lutimaris]
MRIGVPKEIKVHEYRVGLTPMGVRELVAQGHEVRVERDAGSAIGYSDQHYIDAGAAIVEDAEAVFREAQMVVKVKEPQLHECAWLSEGQVLFTYLHLAADRPQTDALLASGCTAIAYETVEDLHGGLPLLAPMSEVAGRMSVQAGAHCLEREQGGRGVLLSGVPGVSPGKVLVIGGGVVGGQAARIAHGMGAEVWVVDKSLPRLRELDEQFNGQVKTLYSSGENIRQKLAESDLVIGAVLVPGAKAPKLVTREMLALMPPGAVLVDVAIDQGGCFETSHPTTHAEPTFMVDGIVHYCVANMPGAVARTATQSLTNATLPYVEALANKGWQAALASVPGFAPGLNVHAGRLYCEGVAAAFDLPLEEIEELLQKN